MLWVSCKEILDILFSPHFYVITPYYVHCSVYILSLPFHQQYVKMDLWLEPTLLIHSNNLTSHSLFITKILRSLGKTLITFMLSENSGAFLFPCLSKPTLALSPSSFAVFFPILLFFFFTPGFLLWSLTQYLNPWRLAFAAFKIIETNLLLMLSEFKFASTPEWAFLVLYCDGALS